MHIELVKFSAAETRSIIELELSLHPQAEFIDLYKLLFQAYSGPSHMAGERQQIIQSIMDEMQYFDSYEEELFQDIGAGKGFYRINLNAREDLCPWMLFNKDDLQIKISSITDCIMASRISRDLWFEQWLDIWPDLLPTVLDYSKATDQQIKFCLEKLSNTRLVSHSSKYRELYKPHYRIVHNSFKNHINNMLSSGGGDV